MKNLIFLALALGLVGCSSSAPSSPSAVSQANVPPLPAMASVSGMVVDTGFRGISGARVEVVDGPLAGLSATTDAQSRFTLTGPFDRTTKFRAIKQDHVTVTQTASVYCADLCYGALQLYLPPVGPSVNLSGDYTLTFVADSACPDLPDGVRTRSYAATIAPNPNPGLPADTSLLVAVSGAPFLGNYKSFTIGVAGDYFGLSLNGGESASIVEELQENTYLAFSGTAAATAEQGAAIISTPFSGWIEYCATKSPMSITYGCGISAATGQPIPGEVVVHALCESTNHRLILSRR